MLEGDDLGQTFQNFESERRPRAERIVAIARRNGNNKREFTATGAWIRDRMLKYMIPIGSRAMDFMYAYDPCAVTVRRGTLSRHDRLAA